METNMTKKNKYNLDSLKQAEFKRAKRWWFYSNVSNILIIFFGLVANLWPAFAPTLAFFSTIFVVFSFVSQWYSDSAKENAEWLLRQLEMCDGLGWPVDEQELCGIAANIPARLHGKLDEQSDHKYFDSKEKASAQRLVDNFMQSSFYTKYQARFVSKVILSLGIGVILLSVFTAIVALQNPMAVDSIALS